MASHRPRILDQLGALSEEVRCRILLVCEAHELTVTELCQTLQLPQSTVSRHLKVLADQGWLTRRREGTRAYYELHSARLPVSDRRLWLVVRESLDDDANEADGADEATVRGDRQRLAAVLADRRSRSAEFFDSSAEGWDELRRELYGARFDVLGLLGLVDADTCVGDLGCGTGRLSALLAPVVRQVIAVDSSAPMLAAARQRLAGLDNVRVAPGALENLPIEDASLDAATLFLVLHHVAEPRRVLLEARRALKPGGRLLIVDMIDHENEELRQRLGHVWLGFPAKTMTRLLGDCGFDQIKLQPLPIEPDAKGPPLFLARGASASNALRTLLPNSLTLRNQHTPRTSHKEKQHVRS